MLIDSVIASSPAAKEVGSAAIVKKPAKAKAERAKKPAKVVEPRPCLVVRQTKKWIDEVGPKPRPVVQLSLFDLDGPKSPKS